MKRHFAQNASAEPSLQNCLAAQVRDLTGSTMSQSEAADAARNLAGYVRLLAEIDSETQKQGSEGCR